MTEQRKATIAIFAGLIRKNAAWVLAAWTCSAVGVALFEPSAWVVLAVALALPAAGLILIIDGWRTSRSEQ